MSHEQLILGRDGGGPRHFLAGRPVTCGSTLEVLDEASGRWLTCGFEVGYAAGKQEPRLHGVKAGVTQGLAAFGLGLAAAEKYSSYVVATALHRLRWPRVARAGMKLVTFELPSALELALDRFVREAPPVLGRRATRDEFVAEVLSRAIAATLPKAREDVT